MRRNSEQLAWAVLWLAFVLFCAIIIGVPLGVRHYLLYAEEDQSAYVESLAGTVVIEPPLGTGAVPLGKGQNMMVPEGAVVRVDEKSEALVTFFDGEVSTSVMRLFSSTTVRLDKLRFPRFRSLSPLPGVAQLTLQGGRVRIGTALTLSTPVEFRVATLHGVAVLDPDGSYAVEATNERAEVAAYRGRALVRAAGGEVELGVRQRTLLALGQVPQAPMSVARNLLINGDLAEALDVGWRVFNDQGADGGSVDGQAEAVVDEGRRAVRFLRSGGQGNHCETVLEQTVDKPLPDPLTSLVVRATVKVRQQSLSGGGYLSSEYPLMIRLVYRDAYDSEAEWIQGFYHQNITANPVAQGLQLPQDRWYLFDSGNLLGKLPVKPFKIVRLRVYASGWDYESLISDISLVAE